MAKKSVRDLPVQGRRVLIRADLNVPLDNQQRITDDRRIRMFLPTLKHVVAAGGRAIVMSHLGRPKGDPATDAAFSLKPVALRLHELLDAPVNFVNDCVGGAAQDAVARLASGHTLLLENLRFHKAETIIDKAKKNLDGRLTVEQDTARTEFASAWPTSAKCTSTTPSAPATADTSACTTSPRCFPPDVAPSASLLKKSSNISDKPSKRPGDLSSPSSAAPRSAIKSAS
jgi:hypothetical protein